MKIRSLESENALLKISQEEMRVKLQSENLVQDKRYLQASQEIESLRRHSKEKNQELDVFSQLEANLKHKLKLTEEENLQIQQDKASLEQALAELQQKNSESAKVAQIERYQLNEKI